MRQGLDRLSGAWGAVEWRARSTWTGLVTRERLGRAVLGFGGDESQRLRMIGGGR